MRRLGFLLVAASCIGLFDGCSGSSHVEEDDTPVVQEMNIQSGSSSNDPDGSDEDTN